MKLHLPSTLRKAVMACLALSLNGTMATTLSTGALCLGACLVCMNQAEARDISGGTRGGGWQADGTIEEDVRLTGDAIISPQSSEVTITGTLNAQGYTLTVWNNGANGPYSLTLTGKIENLGDIALGGRNTLVIDSDIACANSSGTLNVLKASDATGPAGAAGTLVLKREVSGYSTINVEQVTDGGGISGSLEIAGTFNGTGALEKTGAGSLTISGALKNVTSFTANGGITSLTGTAEDLEQVNVGYGATFELSGTAEDLQNVSVSGGTFTMSGVAKNLRKVNAEGSSIVTLAQGSVAENLTELTTTGSKVIIDGSAANLQTLTMDGKQSTVTLNGNVAGLKSITLQGENYGVSPTVGRSELNINTDIDDLSSLAIKHLSVVNLSGNVTGAIDVTLLIGTLNVQEDATLYLNDGSSITMDTEGVYTNTLNNLGVIAGEGTLSKYGQDTLMLAGEIKHFGTLAIQEGAVQWGSDGQSQQGLSFTEVEVGSGATFVVNHSAADVSSTDISLAGGKLEIVSAATENAAEPLLSNVVSFGKLTIKPSGDAEEARAAATEAAPAVVSVAKVAQDKVCGVAFSELTGSGVLNITSDPSTSGAGKSVFILKSINNFDGKVVQSLGTKDDGAYVKLGAVHLDDGHAVVWEMAEGVTAVSSNFAKTGAGSFTIKGADNSLFAVKTEDNGEFVMGYDGTFTLDGARMTLELGEGTTLRYTAEKRYDFAPSDITLDGVVYVNMADFSEEQLANGVSLGLRSSARGNVQLVGLNKLEIYTESGELHLRTASDANWSEQIKQDANKQLDSKNPEALVANFGKDYTGLIRHGVGLTDKEDGYLKKSVILTKDTFTAADVNKQLNNVVGGSAVNFNVTQYNLNDKEEGHGLAPEWREVYAGEVWMHAQSGSYGILAGGNYADAKAGFHDDNYQRTDGTMVGIYVTFDAGHYAVSFEGDTHIIVGEKDAQAAAPTVESIVGGNYGNSVWHVSKDKTNSFMQNGEPLTSSFIGNSWISVYNGQVDWIIGGSYQSVYDFPRSAMDHSAVQDVVADPTKFSQGSFTGNSHVYVYTLMVGDGRNDPNKDFVAGGNLIDMQASLDYLSTPTGNNGTIPGISADGGKSEGTEWERTEVGAGKANSIPFYFNGNSYVMVDLGRDKGEEVENPGKDSEFGKMLVGGDYIRHDRGWAERCGNTYVLITNAKGVKFTERVIGGSYDDGNSYTHMTGDSNLMIDSGTYYNMVVAGSNQGKITDMHAAEPITSLRKALFSIIEGGTYLTITGGRFTGYASSLEERIPHYTLASRDHLDAIVRHSIGRVAIVGGNYLSQAANATKNLMTLNKINNGTHLSISNAVISGHVVGASVMEGDSHHDNDDNNNSTNGSGESDQWVPGFRGDLYVSSVTLKIDNTQMIRAAHSEEDSSYTAEGWVPRIVGGYLLHVADDCLNDQIVTAQWDKAGEGFYYPGIEVGKIDLTITNSSVYDVVGGSWVACLDVYAEEIYDFLTYDCKKRDDGTTYNLDGVRQDDITISMDKVNVKGDIVAAGMQGGITKIVTAQTTVNLTSDITFEEPTNPYRKENIVTGAYFSIRHKNYAASRDKNTWDNEFDPWYSFYADMHYADENTNVKNADVEGESSRHNVSYVKNMRTLNFTTDSNTYGDKVRNTILLNFDHVDVAPRGIVNAAGLLITDTGNDGTRDTIYLHGGGEMQLVPDFMLIPVWEEKDANGTLSVPEVASSYKWLHNNSYIVVQGQGTMLTLLPSETRGVKYGDRQDWITMGEVYDNLLNVQKLRVENGSILHIDQRLELNSALKVNAQPVAVRDNIYMCQGSSMMLDTNISLNEMRTREDAAIREAEIITDLRTDAKGNVTNGKAPEANRDPYTVIFDGAKGAKANPSFRLHIDRVEQSFYEQDKFRRYLIDYVNPEAFNSLWAREFGEEITDTDGSISYDKYTQETLDKWFAKSEYINGYDKYRIRVKDNDDGTFSLVLEGMRVTPNPDEPDIPEPPAPDKSTGYHQRRSRTPNGRAGGKLLDEYYPDPSDDSPDRDDVLKRIFELNVEGRTDESDRLQAAVAGSSIAALGMAFSDDLDRQLRLMRNRATKNLHKPGFITKTETIDRGKAGIDIHQYPEYMPPKRYGLWINGEGDFRSVNGVSTDPGYRMNAWGGTVGGSYSVTDNVEAGLALTAMYGDFRSKGPDALNGDMDTKYLSAFARYDSGHWSHSFISTFGLVDVDATRTVNIGGEYGSYSTHFSTDGYALGLMYEVGYTFELNEEKTLTLQPIANIAWRHTLLNGFTETGSDAALRVGDQKSDLINIGAGARAQALVGSESMNRDFLFELRALAKSGLGKSRNTVEVGFADRSQRARVRSRKLPSIGFEVGGGVTVPLTPNTATWEHAIFMDVNIEVFGALRNANFTVGYKLSF